MDHIINLSTIIAYYKLTLRDTSDRKVAICHTSHLITIHHTKIAINHTTMLLYNLPQIKTFFLLVETVKVAMPMTVESCPDVTISL